MLLDPFVKKMRFFLIGISIGIIYWIFDSVIDAYVFHSGDFLSMMFSPGGEEIWNRILVIIFMMMIGAVHATIGTTHFKLEIKRQKTAEEILRQNHNLLRAIIEGTTDAIYLRDLEGRYLMINSVGARILGKAPEELIGKGLTELFPPEFIKTIIEADQKTLKTGLTETLEYKIRINGNEHAFLTTRGPIRNLQNAITGIFGISRDITERKLAEEKLKSEHAFRRAIEEALLIGIVATDLTGKLIYVNQYFCEMVGWTAEELFGTFAPRLYWPPEEIENIRNAFQSSLMNQEPPKALELRFWRKNGERFPVLGYNANLLDGNGNKMGIVASFVDISDRKKSEESLRQSEEKFRLLIENIKEVFWITSSDFKELYYISPSYEKVWGKSMESLYKAPFSWMEPIHPEDRPRVMTEIESVLPNSEFLSEFRIVRPDGTIFWIRCHGFPVKNGSEEVFRMVGIAEDITEKRRMEEESHKFQKLESLGILAGGIAHDFNNILTGILGNISLAKTWIDPKDWLFTRLDEAERASLRASELARQLLTFAKGGAPIKKIVSIQKIIEDSVHFALRGFNVQSRFLFQEGLWPVKADEGQISQVMQNLVINAQQAMPEGGTVRIVVKNLTIGEDGGQGVSLRKGDYLFISIQDQGTGISKEHLSKIFDPYFTTKQKGSGLGLSITYSIIQRHYGYITVESNPGTGTTVFVYLPASSESLLLPEKAEVESINRGKGRILVMDDEETILQIAGEIFRHLSYEVHLAKNGTEAVWMYKNAKDSGDPFDIVITDLTVPGDIGGVETLRRLKEIDSQVKVIVSSGYSNDPTMADFKAFGFSDCLKKPYRAFEISAAVERVLKGKRLDD